MVSHEIRSGTARRPRAGRALAGLLAVAAAVAAVFVHRDSGPLPAGSARVDGLRGRVAIVSIEGLGPTDLARHGLADRTGRLLTRPRTAYGLIRSGPRPASAAIWWEVATGDTVGSDGPPPAPERLLWNRARAAGLSVEVQVGDHLPSADWPARRPLLDTLPAADSGRLEAAIAAWQGGAADLVVVRIDGLFFERARARQAGPACEALIRRCLDGIVLASRGEQTAILCSSTMPVLSGREPADAGSPSGPLEPEQLAPGIVVVAGPGVVSQSWPGLARLTEVAPTAMHLLGLPVPPDVQGGILDGMLSQSFLFHDPVE